MGLLLAAHVSLSLGGKFRMNKTLRSLAAAALAVAGLLAVISLPAGAAAKLKPTTCYGLSPTTDKVVVKHVAPRKAGKREIAGRCASGYSTHRPDLQGTNNPGDTDLVVPGAVELQINGSSFDAPLVGACLLYTSVVFMAGLVVIGVVVAFLSASTVRDGVALSVVAAVAIACLATLSTPGLRDAHPALARAALTAAVVDVALFATYFFSGLTNYNLAIGAAMAIVLLGLSFLTGASGQISLGNAAFMGVGALVVAMWANHHATTPIVAVLVIAIASGALVGFLLGLRCV